MKLSREHKLHSEFHLCEKAGLLKADANCECGIKELHEHCKGCGKVASIGSGTVIKEFKLNIS